MEEWHRMTQVRVEIWARFHSVPREKNGKLNSIERFKCGDWRCPIMSELSEIDASTLGILNMTRNSNSFGLSSISSRHIRQVSQLRQMGGIEIYCDDLPTSHLSLSFPIASSYPNLLKVLSDPLLRQYVAIRSWPRCDRKAVFNLCVCNTFHLGYGLVLHKRSFQNKLDDCYLPSLDLSNQYFVGASPTFRNHLSKDQRSWCPEMCQVLIPFPCIQVWPFHDFFR